MQKRETARVQTPVWISTWTWNSVSISNPAIYHRRGIQR